MFLYFKNKLCNLRLFMLHRPRGGRRDRPRSKAEIQAYRSTIVSAWSRAPRPRTTSPFLDRWASSRPHFPPCTHFPEYRVSRFIFQGVREDAGNYNYVPVIDAKTGYFQSDIFTNADIFMTAVVGTFWPSIIRTKRYSTKIGLFEPSTSRRF